MDESIDAEILKEDLSAAWLELLPPDAIAESQQLIGQLVEDWVQEAYRAKNPMALLAFIRGRFEQAWSSHPAADRLRRLRVEVLRRILNRLHVTSYRLGVAIIREQIAVEPARVEGRSLLIRVDELRSQTQALLGDPLADSLNRILDDVWLEANFVLGNAAMSRRLGDYIESRSRSL